MDGKFPLQKLLKGRLLAIAELQDRLMIEMVSRFGIVLHGGTAIWRVYGGKRFSFDLDLYYQKPREILDHFNQSGEFEMTKARETRTGVVYLRFSGGRVVVEVEASPQFGERETADGEYSLVDGDTMVVRTLTASALVKEKIEAFKGRGKARDLYDVFYLLDRADPPKTREAVKSLLPLALPKDFSGLKELILLGKSPDFELILRKVGHYANGQVQGV